MKIVAQSALMATTILLCTQVMPCKLAVAQQAVTPAPDPGTGTAPAPSGDAQETHDEVAIQQVMKMVELSRVIAGGIGQLFNSAQGQKQTLDELYRSQTGARTTPPFGDDNQSRDGGEGLKELSAGALTGAITGPQGLIDAFNDLKSKFKLSRAFDLQNDELPSKKMLAELAARAAISGATAENSFKRANVSMTRIEAYGTALDDSKDLKQSIDLNTRAMLELTQQTNEALRTQAAITSIISSYFMMLASEASEADWVDGLKNFNR